MRKWLVATFVVVITVLAGCGGGGNGAGTGGIGLGPGFGGQPGSSGGTAPKIIIDSDYNTMSDDGQLGVMAAQLQARGLVRVMGITVVSGNQWLKQGVADALKSVERLGVGDRIGIYAGANYALQPRLPDHPGRTRRGCGGRWLSWRLGRPRAQDRCRLEALARWFCHAHRGAGQEARSISSWTR
jgi:purine nucleosidase